MKVLIVGEGKHEGAGALETLVRRLNPSVTHFEHDRLSRNDIHAHHGTGQGFLKRAIRWMREAERQGFQAIVLLADEDGREGRRREIDQAQVEERLTRISRALGVAIRSFDAWILADEQALSRVLHSQVQRQRNPESLVNPKQICRQLSELCSFPIGPAQMYAAVADMASLELMVERCPEGFAPFAARVRNLSSRTGN